MDLIKKEVTLITREKQEQMRNMASNDVGIRPSTTEKNHLMVGFDDVLLRLLDRLTYGNTNRQIIPIVGMGGIGKTTLAKGAFEHPLIKEHFDICVWATISQDYNITETLRKVLSQISKGLNNESGKDLGEKLHKSLAGMRYLVVLDDMWSIEVWDKMKFFFPEYSNKSRIIVTTRISSLAAHLTDSYSDFKMGFLGKVSSWNLFCKTVFGEQSFPTQLESIGKKIVEKCNGLPLSIVVIGGLIAKSEPTLGYWEYIEGNLSSIVNSENDDFCLRILRLSYNHLPVYLKPCFLYMGMFEEDCEISVSTIVKLWISEGFLKPINNKSLNTIAKEYLKELADRNLILVNTLGILGNIKSCKIHDLLRDLSMKEAQKQRFLYVLREQSPQGAISQRHIVIPRNTSKEKILNALESMSHARSYFCYKDEDLELPNYRCLRTLHANDTKNVNTICPMYSLENVFHLVNSQYLNVRGNWKSVIHPINLLWNLHTLVIKCDNDFIAPIEIWKMQKLRHVHFPNQNLHLPDPPSIDSDIIILKNLEALRGVIDFSLSEDVIKRIPNIKKLEMKYSVDLFERVNSFSCLQYASKLECLMLRFNSTDNEMCLLKMSFPPSLKKLSLSLPTDFELEDILPMIGSLPLLQKLALHRGRFRTRKWETIEGQFPSLMSLKLYSFRDLENWIVTESSHFPLLKQLFLCDIKELKEIPSEIGEIPTLQKIDLLFCNLFVGLSAKRILEEQEDLHGDQSDLEVRFYVVKNTTAQRLAQRLASSNFKVIVIDV